MQDFGLLGTLIPGPYVCGVVGARQPESGDVTPDVVGTISAATAGTIVIALLWSVRGRYWLQIVPVTLLAFAVANGIGLIVSFEWTLLAGMSWVVAALSASLPSAFLSARSPFERLMAAGAIAVIGAVPVTVLWGHLEVSGTAVAGICLVSASLTLGGLAALKWWQRDQATCWDLGRGTVGSLPMVAMASTGYLAARSGGAGNLVALCVGAVAGGLVFTATAWTVRTQFQHVIAGEELNDRSVERQRSLWRAYVAAVAAFASALLALILYVLGTSGIPNWDSVGRSDYRSLIEPAVVLLVLIIVSTICRVASSTTTSGLWVVQALCAVIWTCEMCRQLGEWPSDPWLLVIAALTSVIAGLFVGESFRSNMAYLGNHKCGLDVMTVAVCYGIAVGLTAWWICVPSVGTGIQVQQFGYSTAALVIGGGALVLLPWLAAFSLPERVNRFRIQTPVGGVLQDCSLMLILTLSVGWLPSLLQVHLSTAEDCIGAILFYLSLVGASYMYVMNNNLGHVRRETTRVAKEVRADDPTMPEEQKALKSLARHVAIQNWLALVAILPIGVVALISEFDGFQSGSVLDLVRVEV